MAEAALEIGALTATRWTGIPAVTAALAEAALGDPAVDWQFMIDRVVVPPHLVERMLIERSGAAVAPRLATLAFAGTMPDPARAALFPNIKPVRGHFAREAIVIHDLSPLLTPQFHDPANIAFFADHIRGDIATSERIFCVSDATARDVTAYLGVPAARIGRIVPGVAFDAADLSAALGAGTVEPYVVLLGTLEPRKNGRLMLEHLTRDPGFANRYRIVFIGGEGWLDERARLIAAADAAGVPPGRILFTGYLPEREKVVLMLNAAFCIYPALFEGYGLPVLEAAVLGRLTVCADSSSLPEVAPHATMLFDPCDHADFARALAGAEVRVAGAPRAQSLGTLLAHAAEADAGRIYPPVAEWVRGG